MKRAPFPYLFFKARGTRWVTRRPIICHSESEEAAIGVEQESNFGILTLRWIYASRSICPDKRQSPGKRRKKKERKAISSISSLSSAVHWSAASGDFFYSFYTQYYRYRYIRINPFSTVNIVTEMELVSILYIFLFFFYFLLL